LVRGLGCSAQTISFNGSPRPGEVDQRDQHADGANQFVMELTSARLKGMGVDGVREWSAD
jgi:hypothetical protein